MDVSQIVKVADLNKAEFKNGKVLLSGEIEAGDVYANGAIQFPVADEELGKLAAGMGTWWAKASEDGSIEKTELVNGALTFGPLLLAELVSRGLVPDKYQAIATMALAVVQGNFQSPSSTD